MGLVEWGVGAAALFAATTFLIAYKHHNAFLATLTGVTAGLFAVQVANIHVFTVVVTLWWLTASRTEPRRTPMLIIACTLPVALTAFIGDLVNNPLLGAQLLALAIGGAMVADRSTPDSERRMLRGLLATCTFASAAGLGQVIGVLPAELVHQDISGLGRPSGIYPEPDWLGLFAGIGLVLAMRTTTGLTRVLVGAVNGAAFLLAFARATWVAVAFAVLVYLAFRLFMASRAPDRKSPLGTILLFAGIAVVILTALPDVRADLITRVSTLFERRADDVSGQARIQQTQGLTALIDTAPWHGHGISASGRVGVSGIYNPNSENSVGSNWILSLLVDAKFLALPLIGLLTIAALRRALTVPGQLLVVLLVSNLFSNATIQPVTWMMLGLAMTTAVHGTAHREPQAGDSRGQLSATSRP